MPEKDPKDAKVPEPPKAESQPQELDEESLDKVAGGLGTVVPFGTKEGGSLGSLTTVCLSQT